MEKVIKLGMNFQIIKRINAFHCARTVIYVSFQLKFRKTNIKNCKANANKYSSVVMLLNFITTALKQPDRSNYQMKFAQKMNINKQMQRKTN